MTRKLKNEELDRLEVSEFKEAEKTPIIIILDNIRSLNNIGSVFRIERVKIMSIEQAENAIMLNDFKPQPNTKYAFVFGNEVKGVSQDVVSASDVVIEIPQYGTKHSLNISVSCGVVVWDVFSKLRNL